MAINKKKTSFTLSEEALRLLEIIAKDSGLSMASMVEVLIREKARAIKK